MGYKVKVSPVAKRNIKEAADYYKKKVSLKVAQNFVLDYEDTVGKIQLNPYFQIYYKNFRGLSLKKYPYIIFYQVDEFNELILVKAVFNTHQDPDKYPQR